MSDLISRKAAIEVVEKAVTKECARWAIQEIPPVDVAPVVHAYWIGLDSDAEKYDDIKCSACGKCFTVDAGRWCDIGFIESDLAYWIGLDSDAEKYGDLNYCPNCGAKMDN